MDAFFSPAQHVNFLLNYNINTNTNTTNNNNNNHNHNHTSIINLIQYNKMHLMSTLSD